jgi:hypothetical protein
LCALGASLKTADLAQCEELRKIRLEASLPPEGLPESLPSKRAAAAGSTSTPGSAKRKASGDALAAQQAKRSATTAAQASTSSKEKEREGSAKAREGSAAASTPATNSPTTAEASRLRMPHSAAQAEPSPLGVSAAAAAPASMPQPLAAAPPTPAYPTPLSHVNLVFGDGQGLGFSGASGPSLWGMTPPSSSAPSAEFFRTGMTPGASESDALLASLFGADALSSFGASMAAPSPGMRAALPPHVASPISMASGSAAALQQQMAPPSHPSASPGRFAAGGSAVHSRHGSNASASASLIEAVAEVTSRAMSAVGNGEMADEIERINAVVRRAAEKRRRLAGHVPSPSSSSAAAGEMQDGNRMAQAPYVAPTGRTVGPEELERLGEASAQVSVC